VVTNIRTPAKVACKVRFDASVPQCVAIIKSTAEPATLPSATALGQHFLDIFRTYHGPILKAFEAPEEAGRKALARDILDLIGRFSTSGDETRFFRADICKLSAPSDESPVRPRRKESPVAEVWRSRSEKSRWVTPAALIHILPRGIHVLDSATRLLCADYSQLSLRREIPEHGSDQQERRHVADQMTYLVSVMHGLYCHDAGVHDARPDRE
jgi:hypothetical protein